MPPLSAVRCSGCAMQCVTRRTEAAPLSAADETTS